ncbi:MAG: hypothetical protein SFW36_12710 [Leptolyngbyaceae cyanobacterium bins.59]|nr:hypothetical protein [Leptolyngbyaceae cyanobacterium bins.59]
MILPRIARSPRPAHAALLSTLLVLGLVPAVRAQSKPAPVVSPAAPSNPTELKPLTQDASILSIQGGQRLMNEASSAVSSQRYDIAVQKLQEARQVFNQLSNFYQDLASSFSGIDNRIADLQRRRALETAQMRDQATYQLALVHRAQNQPELSVPLLIQIIRSQQPTRDLGRKAYQQLFELGFVESPYPPQGGPSVPSTSSSK